MEIIIAEKMAVEKLQFHWMAVLNKPSQKRVPSSDIDKNGTLNLTDIYLQLYVHFCLS